MSYKPDDTDRRILAALAKNGRLSNTDLARQVGLSPSPCWQRVKRLEEVGIITGYAVILDHDALGVGETVMIEVVLDHHDAKALEGFEKAVIRHAGSAGDLLDGRRVRFSAESCGQRHAWRGRILARKAVQGSGIAALAV